MPRSRVRLKRAFLQLQGLGDQRLGPLQLAEVLAHLAHQRGHQAPQHGLAHAETVHMAHGPAHDPPQHVAAALVGRQDAVGDEERRWRAGGRR